MNTLGKYVARATVSIAWTTHDETSRFIKFEMHWFGRLSSVVGLCLTMLGAAASAPAGVIVGDGFEGETLGALYGQSGGTNGTGSWGGAYGAGANNYDISVVSGGLSYTNGAISINGGSQHARIGYTAGTIDNVLSRPFTGQTGTVYFSFLFRPDTGFDANDFVQFLINDDTVDENAGSIGKVNQNGNYFFSRVRGPANETNVNANTGGAPTPAEDVTYLLVGKLSKDSSSNYNRMDLFINPSSLTEPAAYASAVYNAATFNNVDYFSLRIAGLDVGDRYDFDELRIGTSYLDVVSNNMAAVPEPSSLALAGIAAAGWGVRRIRRRAAKSAV